MLEMKSETAKIHSERKSHHFGGVFDVFFGVFFEDLPDNLRKWRVKKFANFLHKNTHE